MAPVSGNLKRLDSDDAKNLTQLTNGGHAIFPRREDLSLAKNSVLAGSISRIRKILLRDALLAEPKATWSRLGAGD
jgi:hypothetical protein